MRILFTTPLALYSLDVKSRKLSRLLNGPAEFYGISGLGSKVVLSHSRMDTESLRSHQDLARSRRGGLSVTSNRGFGWVSENCLLAVHQIVQHEDAIVCANTGMNCITVVRKGRLGTTRKHYYPTVNRWDVSANGDKANHFNSVLIHGGLLYAVAHNHDRYSSVWKFTWPRMKLVDVVATTALWAHNLWKAETELFILNSKGASLYAVGEQRDVWKHDASRYLTRGLAVTRDRLIIGLSALSASGGRNSSDSGICVVDRATLKTLDVLIFAGIGGVHEIRLLDEADECHPNVLSLPKPWLHSAAVVTATAGTGADRHETSTASLSAR